MSTMVTNAISKNVPLMLTAGQSIQIQILNSDGTVRSVLFNDNCPNGVTLAGNVGYYGILA